MKNKYVVLGLILLFVVGIGSIIYLNKNDKTYRFTDKSGRFSIEIPKEMTVKVNKNSEDSSAEAIFYYEDTVAMVVSYQSPEIEGKGGACTVGYKDMKIAGQTVQTCTWKEEFTASYFKNPNKDIEYSISIASTEDGQDKLTSEQFKALKTAVIETLEFN